MPAIVAWSGKHAPDPEHPGYVKVVGSYASEFLDWAKLFGKPAWSRDGIACVLGFDKRHQEVDYDPRGQVKSIVETRTMGWYWPLHVLEPLYYSMKDRKSPTFLIDPNTGEYITRSSI